MGWGKIEPFDGVIRKGTRCVIDPGFVYFVSEGHGGAIKIGWTIDPAERLARLQVGNSRRLRVIGLIWARPGVEAEWHRRWKSQRGIGEWFKRTPELTAAIKAESTHHLTKHRRDGLTTRAGRIKAVDPHPEITRLNDPGYRCRRAAA